MDKSRIIILDTELTGTNPIDGDRIISLGLVEIFNQTTIGDGREWFFNPEGKEIPQWATDIHGITNAMIEQYPNFANQIDDICAFIGNSPIYHHCWVYKDEPPLSVDEKFMAVEFARAGHASIPHENWTNMKYWAMALDPSKNSLNDMLNRFGIDKSPREKHHGALIDAQLTAELFIKFQQNFNR